MLTTDRATYPMWRCARDLELPMDGSPLEYKLVIVRARSDNSAHAMGEQLPPLLDWEPLKENRRIAPHAHHGSKAAHVSLAWGQPGASLSWRWEW